MLCLGNPGFTQPAAFREEIFLSPESGIRHVVGMAPGVNNFLWIATQKGIYRYDGSGFRHYSVKNTPLLKFERMGSLVHFERSGQNPDWVIVDSKGNFYRVNKNCQLESYSPGSKKPLIRYQFLFPSSNYYPGNPAIDEHMIYAHELHSTSAYHRIYILKSNSTVVRASPTPASGESLVDEIFKYPGDRRDLSVATTDSNFYLASGKGILCWKNDSLYPRPSILTGDLPLTGKDIKNAGPIKILLNPGSGSFVFYCDKGIYEATEVPGSYHITTRLLTRLTTEEIPASIFYSAKLRVLACYFQTKGLIFYRPNEFSLLSVTTNEKPFEADYYYSLIPHQDGFLTINNNGLTWLGMNRTERLLLGRPLVKYFFHVETGHRIWCQDLLNRDILIYDLNTKKVFEINKLEEEEVFTGLQKVSDSMYYLHTTFRLLQVIISKEHQVKEIRSLLDFPDRSAVQTFLYPISNDKYWLGSDKGLAEYNVRENRFTPVREMDGVYARAAIQLEPGHYLVGSYDKGIFRFRDGKWSPLGSADEKLPASAHAFVIDSVNRQVWVSSNEGIISIPLSFLLNRELPEKTKVPFRHFTQFGSEISVEFNGASNLSGSRLSDKCIAFANARGLVYFDPSRQTSFPLPGFVSVEPILDSSGNGIPDPRQLAFRVAIPYYGNPEELQIQYMLSNTDRDWHDLNRNDVITYNNLSPGNHTLSFRLRYRYDPEGKEVVINSGTFEVPVRWFETRIFKLFMFLAGLGVIILLHQLRLWYLVRRKKELEVTVKSKTAELQESNTNLSAVIEELRVSESQLRQSNFLKDEYYSVLTHDLRSPLRFLSFNISQLLEKLPESDAAQLRKGLLSAYECTNDVQKLIEEFVVWIRDNDQKLKVQPVPTRIEAVVNDVKKIYDHGMEGNQNRLVTDVEGDLVLLTDPKMLFIILRNAVDNANKYTEKGTITVSAKRQNGTLELSVKDTGRGMRKELVNELMALQDEPAESNLRKRKSLGFYIMSMLTRKLDGRYTITSDKDQGTELKFILPDWKTRT